jgi:hypothetical protein
VEGMLDSPCGAADQRDHQNDTAIPDSTPVLLGRMRTLPQSEIFADVREKSEQTIRFGSAARSTAIETLSIQLFLQNRSR